VAIGLIRVHRTPESWGDRLRAYRVVLDGTVVGRVKRAESITLEVNAGHHELHLTIDWARSPSVKLDLVEGEEVDVRCWPNGRPITALYWITFGRSRYIGIEASAAGRGLGEQLLL